MKLLVDETIQRNSGRAFVVKKGQRIRVIGQSTVDFIAFNLNDLRERFDQARTKSNDGKIFVTKGDNLWSKRNNVMLTITEDTFADGHHDLQKGMCSRKRHEMVFQGKVKRDFGTPDASPNPQTWEAIPDHGCWENLTAAVKEWKIEADDVPSPFNIFQNMKIDGETGKMNHTKVRPLQDAYVEMLAEMDCLVAASACPDHGARPETLIRIQVYQ